MVFVQAFFDEEYIGNHPQDVERISKLRAAMQEQVRPQSLADSDAYK